LKYFFLSLYFLIPVSVFKGSVTPSSLRDPFFSRIDLFSILQRLNKAIGSADGRIVNLIYFFLNKCELLKDYLNMVIRKHQSIISFVFIINFWRNGPCGLKNQKISTSNEQIGN
jgi:hypothetical protein